MTALFRGERIRTVMGTGTTVFRLVILVVVVMLGWSLRVACMEGRTPDQVTVGYPAESDCPPSPGLFDCCITTQPFVAVRKVLVPRLELAGLQITTLAPFTLDNLFPQLPIGLFDKSPPPGDKQIRTYLTVSILRI